MKDKPKHRILTLFDLPEQGKEKPKNRCKHCDFMFNHPYGKMKYCSKQSSKTSIGIKKIKSNDPACALFKPLPS